MFCNSLSLSPPPPPSLSLLKNSLNWSLLCYCSVRMMSYFRQKLDVFCFVFNGVLFYFLFFLAYLIEFLFDVLSVAMFVIRGRYAKKPTRT